MRFFVISLSIHVFVIFIGIFSFTNNRFNISKTGNTSSIDAISINFSSFTSNPVQKREEKKLLKKETLKKEKLRKLEKKKSGEIKEENISNKKKINSSKQKLAPSTNSDLIELSKGVFAAKNQNIKGIEYFFLSQPDPEYPIRAKRIGFNREIVVKVKFLIGFDGEIEKVTFLSEKDKLGFSDEVEKVLKKWKLTPVKLNGNPIKLYFYKEFKFNQK